MRERTLGGRNSEGSPRRSRRAQSGIGTLIVLIALLLIAALAAGVFLNVSQVFQSESAETGEEVRGRVTGAVSVVATVGNVTTVNGTTGVDRVRFIVTTASASQRIQLRDLLVVWAGPDGSYQLTAASDFDNVGALDGEEFAYVVERDGDDSAPLLNSRDDRVAVVVNVSTFGEDRLLPAGDDASATFVTGSGSRTVVDFTVPTTAEGDSTVL